MQKQFYNTIEADKQKTQFKKSCEPVPLKCLYLLQFQPCRAVFPSCRRRLLEQRVHFLPAGKKRILYDFIFMLLLSQNISI
jgi:hypothetical protein